ARRGEDQSAPRSNSARCWVLVAPGNSEHHRDLLVSRLPRGGEEMQLAAAFFITDPDAVIAPSGPVPDCPLNERGHARRRVLAAAPWCGAVHNIFASGERKARDAAGILAAGLGVTGVVTCQLMRGA